MTQLFVDDDLCLLPNGDADDEYIMHRKIKRGQQFNSLINLSNGDIYDPDNQLYIRHDRHTPYPNKTFTYIRDLNVQAVEHLTGEEIKLLMSEAAHAPVSIQHKIDFLNRTKREFMMEQRWYEFLETDCRNTYHSIHGTRTSLPGVFRYRQSKNRHTINSQQRKKHAKKKYHKVFKI